MRFVELNNPKQFIGEFSGGLHFQRNNVIPNGVAQPLILDNFAVLRNGSVLTPIQTGVDFQTVANANGVVNTTGLIDFVDGRGGSLQRNFSRGPGFGLYTAQDRNRYEFNSHMQNLAGKHTVKWGLNGSLTNTTSTPFPADRTSLTRIRWAWRSPTAPMSIRLKARA
jgi:hypothetical protein